MATRDPQPAVPRAHERFLRALTPEMTRQVLALPDLLQERREEFVVFTARKSVCLADALRRLGYWQPRGDFTSNRALDGDLGCLEGRDVFIVEDLAASCRTLLSIVDTVRAAGARRVTCFALSVEGPRNDWQKALGLEFASPYLDSHIDDNLRHARSIVDAFAALPRPYNIDWPMHAFRRPISVELATQAGWQCVGSYEGPPGISLTPTRGAMAAVAQLLPAWLAELLNASHLSKVRLYGVHDPHPDGTATFIVPVVALGALRTHEIEEHLARLSELLGAAPPTVVSPREGYRLLQFLLGEMLLLVFAASLGVVPPTADVAAADFLFMPGVREQAVTLQRAVGAWMSEFAWPAARSVRPVRFMQWGDLDAAGAERRSADEFLTELFLKRYVCSEEYRLRQELRQTDRTTARGKIVRRLVQVERASDGASFTAQELRELLQREARLAAIGDARDLVSAFLDRTIDVGEVVPDIDVVGDVITRRFRPGEIINFEQEMQAQVETMLRSFDKRRGEPGKFSADLLQKLVVGFIGYMLERKRIEDLRPADPSWGDVDRLQRRYHLRGAVYDEVSADFVAGQREPEVAKQLVQSEVLERGETSGYVLRPESAFTCSEGAKLDAVIFGRVLADVMGFRDDRGGRLVEQDALNRLITLTNSVDHALALGADMVIAHRHLLAPSGGPLLRALQQRSFQDAMHNGLAKSSWIRSGSSARLIRAIERRMSGDDLDLVSAASVLDSLRPREGDSVSKQVTRRLLGWFQDLYMWSCWAEYVLATGPEEERAARRDRSLRNRAFTTLGGLDPKTRSRRASERLRRHLSGEDPLAAGEHAALVEQVRSELLDGAQELRESCYGISARSLAGVRRNATIESCLLLDVNGSEPPDLADVPGTRAPLVPISAAGEEPLDHVGAVVPVSADLDLERHGARVLDRLDARHIGVVLIADVPHRFRLYDGGQQTAFYSHPFLELVKLARSHPAVPGRLSVLMPAAATSAIATAVRRDGALVGEDDVLSCRWEHWSYAAPGQQLPLAPPEPVETVDAMPVTPVPHGGPLEGIPGLPAGVHIGTMNVYQPTIDAGTHVEIGDVALGLEAIERRLLRAGDTDPADLEAIREGLEHARTEDERGFKRWIKAASPTVRDLLTDFGGEVLKRWLLS